MKSRPILRPPKQQTEQNSKPTALVALIINTNMASRPRRSGNTDLVPPKLRRQSRVILLPLKCDKCQRHGPEVNRCNFTTSSNILCNKCIVSPGPCVRCGKDALCPLTAIVDGIWWTSVFAFETWTELTCLEYPALHATYHPPNPLLLFEALSHLIK